MENRSSLDRFNFHQPWVQIALRAALVIVVVAAIGLAVLRNRIVVQREVASYLARERCGVVYDPIRRNIDEPGEEESGLGFHARHNLVAVTIHSLERADELIKQLSRIDTVKTIRIEYATSGGCAFDVGPRMAAIERIKTTFPNADVEVKITLIAVVG